MAISEFFILLIMGISACATSNVCPASEDTPGCKCESNRYTLTLSCREKQSRTPIQDYRKILLDNEFEHKRNIKLSFSDFKGESRLPSRVFEGFDIIDLTFSFNANISRWADAEGGPAFVGLEDSLKEIFFLSAIHAPINHEDHRQVKNPMSLGHLRKLREVHFEDNDIDTFANGWFDNGPTSLEILTLMDCKIRSIGSRAFASLTNLDIIWIINNKIERLSRTMFPKPANHLEQIHLSFNRLQDLPHDMFTDMPSLRYVYLNENPIMRIPEIVWRPVWSRLKFLLLSNIEAHSSLICDDEIDWIFNVKPPKFFYAICKEPKDMKGVKLKVLIEEKQKKKD